MNRYKLHEPASPSIYVGSQWKEYFKDSLNNECFRIMTVLEVDSPLGIMLKDPWDGRKHFHTRKSLLQLEKVA